jgi:ribose transport system substrate-binding protein
MFQKITSVRGFSAALIRWLAAFGVAAVLGGMAHAAPPKVGLLLKGRTGFWEEIAKGAKEAGDKAGLDVIPKFALTEDNAATQIQLLHALVAQGVDAIVIAPNHEKILSEPVALAAARGIKIVVVDSPLAGGKWPFVGTDQTAAGEAAGHLLAKLAGDTNEVAFFRASEIQSGGATEQREKGAASSLLKEHPSIVIRGNIYSGGDLTIATERASVLLEKYPEAKVVFASGSVGTLAMVHAIEQRHLEGTVKLVGFGYNLSPEVQTALEHGSLHGWVSQLPRDVGVKASEIAAALIKGDNVPPVAKTDFVIITKENVKEPKIQALLAP